MQILKHELLVDCLVFLSSERPVILGTGVLDLVVAGLVLVVVVLIVVVEVVHWIPQIPWLWPLVVVVGEVVHRIHLIQLS